MVRDRSCWQGRSSARVRQAITAVGFSLVDQIVQLKLKWRAVQLPGDFLQLPGNHGELHHQLFAELSVISELGLVVAPVLPAIPTRQRPLPSRHGDLLKRHQAVGLQSQKMAVNHWKKSGLDAFDLLSVQWACDRRWIHVHGLIPEWKSSKWLAEVLEGLIRNPQECPDSSLQCTRST